MLTKDIFVESFLISLFYTCHLAMLSFSFPSAQNEEYHKKTGVATKCCNSCSFHPLGKSS